MSRRARCCYDEVEAALELLRLDLVDLKQIGLALLSLPLK